MSKTYSDEDVEKALALASAGSSVATVAQAVPAPESTVRGWLRRASAVSVPRRPGHPSPAHPATSMRGPSAAPSPADGQTGAPPSPCGGQCRCEERSRPLAASDVCRRLEQRLGELVDQSLDAEQTGRTEDRMLKICRIIEFLRSGDDIDAQLATIRKFGRFCMRTFSETDMRPIRMAISRFLDELKRENS